MEKPAAEPARGPKFSIIIPVYNRAWCLPRVIDSCLEQGHGDFETIVIDDASTDPTIAVAQSYRDARVRLLRRATNGGCCAARRDGVAAARGEWCVWLDSDFALLPGALDHLAEL